MSDNSALARVMGQAEAAAASAAPANLPAQYQAAPSNLPAARPSLQSMVDAAGIQVDEYLTVKEAGFRLGQMKGYFKEAIAELSLVDVVPIFQVRANSGGNTTFIKSYDGIMTPQGQNFQQATQHLVATKDKVDGPYQTAEIPVTLLEDVTDGKETVSAGTTVGITPAITGVKFFTKLVRDVAAAGIAESARLKIKLVHTPQSNKNGNEWGVVAFELIEEIK